MVSRCTIGAMASKKDRASAPDQPADDPRQARRGERACSDNDIFPVGRRQLADFAAFDVDQGMGTDAPPSTAWANPSRSTGQGAARAGVWRGVGAGQVTSEPIRAHPRRAADPRHCVRRRRSERSSSTTSSAKSPVACAAVATSGRISCNTTAAALMRPPARRRSPAPSPAPMTWIGAFRMTGADISGGRRARKWRMGRASVYP